MRAAGCAHCEKFRQAGLERCPKCGLPFAAEAARLVLRDAATGQVWELGEGRFVIGRKDALAQSSLEPGDAPVIMLDDRLVSRRHAVIQGAGSVFCVTDAESRDGTHVNEREITETTAIQEGDRLRFGDTMLVASFERSASAAVPPVADVERTIFQVPAPPEPPARPPPSTTPARGPTPLAPDGTPPAPRAAASGPETVAFVPKSTPAAPRPATPTTPSMRPTAEPMPPTGEPMPRAAEPITPAPKPMRPTAEPVPRTAGPAPRTAEPMSRIAEPMQRTDPTAPAPKALMPSPARPQAAVLPRDFDLELSIVFELFERSGGRQGLKTVLAHARRAEATPEDVDELQTLLAWLPTACRMLETELMLIDLLSARASVAPR